MIVDLVFLLFLGQTEVFEVAQMMVENFQKFGQVFYLLLTKVYTDIQPLYLQVTTLDL